jgi:hypothetical protein
VLDALVTAGDSRCLDQIWVGGHRYAPVEGGEYAEAVRRIMRGEAER